jgi:hypothetical protein
LQTPAHQLFDHIPVPCLRCHHLSQGDSLINEIEDRIFAFSQPEQVENFDVAEYSLKPKTLFNQVRQREKKLISFVLPDSSSDKEDVNFSSGEDIVVGNSCEEEDDDEKLKENVTTTQDDQDYHLEISDDNEDMERECDQIIDEQVSARGESNEHVLARGEISSLNSEESICSGVLTSFFLLTLLSITLSVVLDCSGDFSISLVTESTDLE